MAKMYPLPPYNDPFASTTTMFCFLNIDHICSCLLEETSSFSGDPKYFFKVIMTNGDIYRSCYYKNMEKCLADMPDFDLVARRAEK